MELHDGAGRIKRLFAYSISNVTISPSRQQCCIQHIDRNNKRLRTEYSSHRLKRTIVAYSFLQSNDGCVWSPICADCSGKLFGTDGNLQSHNYRYRYKRNANIPDFCDRGAGRDWSCRDPDSEHRPLQQPGCRLCKRSANRHADEQWERAIESQQHRIVGRKRLRSFSAFARPTKHSQCGGSIQYSGCLRAHHDRHSEW